MPSNIKALPVAVAAIAVGAVIVFGGKSATSPSDSKTQVANPALVGASASSASGAVKVGGSIGGLTAPGLVLQLNNATTVSPASGATAYSFPSTVAVGKNYTVTLIAQPVGKTCSLSGATGTVVSNTNIEVPVTCVVKGSALVDYNVVLGSPTSSSIVASVLAAAGSSVYVEYDTIPAVPGRYAKKSLAVTPPSSQLTNPVATVSLTGLAANTRYYYRVNVKAKGAAAYVPGDQHSFYTARNSGSTFSFGVQGDSHPERVSTMFNADLYKLTMLEVAKRQPDLYFTLGDDFSLEANATAFKNAYCTQFGYTKCGVYGPSGHDKTYGGYGFREKLEGKLNQNAWGLYNSLNTKFVQGVMGENVDGVLDARFSGYGTYLEQRQKYLSLLSHSTSLFLVNGNHELTHYANIGGLFNNLAIWGAEAHNKFYANPAPNGFYTGDTETFLTGDPKLNGFPGLTGDGLLRDYYAFTWGDALFVTIDPYWHSKFSPDSTLFDGDVYDNGEVEPEWDISMGEAQYQWLRKTLENSTAKYKFIFAHHINGNNRGGAAIVSTQEWGGTARGSSESGSVTAFDTNRPGWKPVHQLFVDTKNPAGATIFFMGHDHIFAREMVDGVVYQSVPNPADHSYWAYNCSAYAPTAAQPFNAKWKKADGSGYGVYNQNYSVIRPDTGFVYVTVSPQSVRVDYVRTYRNIDLLKNANKDLYDSLVGRVNGETDFSYSLPASPNDTSIAAAKYSCKGDAPPTDFVYN